MLKLDYFKLPNYIFAADLTHNEFAVLAYLISLHTNIRSKTGDYKRVRQTTIAHFCSIKTAQTVSRIIKSQAQTINRYVQERSASGGEPPTLDEICAALNMEREDVVLALDSTKMPLSLHESVDDGSGEKGVELIDKIPSPEKEDDMVDKILLKSLIEKLPEREKKVIIMRYYRDNTQSEIAEALGVSQVQISRIENKIIKQFKTEL